ncbi:MAG: rod shape-determining protein MreC [Pyrinomonadaceae bacterium]
MALERSQKEVWKLTPWLLIVLLLANFILMAYDARAENEERVIRVWTQAAANFIQSPVTTIGSAVTGYINYLTNLRSAQSENDKLKQKIQELEVAVQESKELTVENRRLKSLLELKTDSEIKIIPAQVIGRDTSVWFNAAIVNRGSLDGVKLNMPIVVNGGLVGRVTAVSPLTAQIDLITRDKSGLGAIVGELGSSNALGVVKGTGDKDVLEMHYVPGYETVKVGDVVYTTGQGGVYPPGLKLGEVIEVRTGSATVPHQIFIKPSANLYSMQEVAILLYTPPPRPKYEEALPNAVNEEEKSESLKEKK